MAVSANAQSPALAGRLREWGWEVLPAGDLAAARRIHVHQPVQAGLLLLEGVSEDQLGWLEDCLRLCGNMEWVAVVDEGALDTPGLAPVLRQWALSYLFDYHVHPLDWHELDFTLAHALRRARLRAFGDCASGPAADAGNLGLVGHSTLIARLRQDIRKVAGTDAPVLIGGESGSGKELAARAVHQCSRRAGGPFITVNCGAITPSLIHSELFGHERGAFTGATSGKVGLIEAANGGTLFFDEIADLPLELQTSLLRFLQERCVYRVSSTRSLPVDVRVLAASHVDTAQAVAAGRFREDLFYRLNVLPITVPPLRERMADVPQLAQYFLQRCLADRPRRRVDGFSRQAMAAMMAHDWQGNVRELGNRVQRATVMTDQRLITPADLGLAPDNGTAGICLDAARTLAERDAIALTLGRVGRNVTHAARELGVSRMTLYRLMDKHGLAPQRPINSALVAAAAVTVAVQPGGQQVSGLLPNQFAAGKALLM